MLFSPCESAYAHQGASAMEATSAARCFHRCLYVGLWTDCVNVTGVSVCVAQIRNKGRLKMDLATKYPCLNVVK